MFLAIRMSSTSRDKVVSVLSGERKVHIDIVQDYTGESGLGTTKKRKKTDVVTTMSRSCMLQEMVRIMMQSSGNLDSSCQEKSESENGRFWRMGHAW